MAIKNQVTALVLLTSAALVACTAGAVGSDSAPSGSSQGHDSPITSVKDATPQRGRPHMPISAGRHITTASIASLREADGGEDAGGGSSSGGSSSGGSSGAPSYPSTVSTDTSSYAYGAAITLTYGSMDSDLSSWVGIAKEGTPAWEYAWYAYTEGAASGNAVTVTDLPPGTYVARAFWGTSYEIKGESTTFTVAAPDPAPGTTVTVANGVGGTNEVFGGFESIGVSFTGLAANTAYSVGVFYEHGSNSLPHGWVSATTDAEGAGNASLTDLLSGVTYDVRVLEGSTWKLRGSTRFRVNAAVRAKDNKTSFASNEPIEVEFAGMEGLSFVDKVQLGTAGGAVIETKNADWYWSGTITFDRPAAGSYVARIFNGVNDPTTAKATSASFEVQ